MGVADHRPVDHQGGHHQGHQQLQRVLRNHVVDHHGEEGHGRRHQQRTHRYAALVHLGQGTRGVALLGQAQQHAAVAVGTAVVDRQGGGQHHEVQQVGGGIAADQREDLHEGAAAVGIARAVDGSQQRIPGAQGEQHDQGADIEDQDAVDDLVDGFRDHLLRLVGLGRSEAKHFQAAEGEHDEGHGHHQPADAVGEEAAVGPEVGDRRLLAAATAEQHPAAEDDHADDGDHLDHGEPEFGLAEELHVGQVDGVDHQEEDRGGGPGGNVRPPVVDVLAHGGQLGHAHQDVQHPVVPAGKEARIAAPVLVGEVAERAGNRLFHDHLAELAHDQEGDEAGDGVAEDHRRAGRLDHPGGTEEQTGTDCAAEGDQLDVAILQAALELACVLGITRHYVTFCFCL
ncbi:hypothetical protein D9M73_138780 [compost metagenome]